MPRVPFDPECAHLGSAMGHSISGFRASDCRFHGFVGSLPVRTFSRDWSGEWSIPHLVGNHPQPHWEGFKYFRSWSQVEEDRAGDWIDGLRHLFLDIVKGQLRWFGLDGIYLTAGLGTPWSPSGSAGRRSGDWGLGISKLLQLQFRWEEIAWPCSPP